MQLGFISVITKSTATEQQILARPVVFSRPFALSLVDIDIDSRRRRASTATTVHLVSPLLLACHLSAPQEDDNTYAIFGSIYP
jgi:hypothetical protein